MEQIDLLRFAERSLDNASNVLGFDDMGLALAYHAISRIKANVSVVNM